VPDAPDTRPAEHRPGPDHASAPRVSWPLLRRQVLDFFQLHSGLPRTLLDLLRRPGTMLREVLFTTARERYTNPAGLMLLSSWLVLRHMPDPA
jgi:hypothetical protein